MFCVHAPSASSIRLEDVARGLALRNRFSGQTRVPYSVSEHCTRGARFLIKTHGPEQALAFLLHELGEALCPDIPTPLKWRITVNRAPEGSPQGVQRISWKALEDIHEAAILYGLDLDHLKPLIHSPEIKAMDLSMLAWEARDLMGTPPADWWPDGNRPVPPTDAKLHPWAWQKAEQKWLDAFKFLVVMGGL
jgi:uncharacterized protein